MSTQLTFTGSKPAADGGVDPVQHVVEGVTVGDGREPLAAQRVAADVDPARPAPRSSSASRRSVDAVGGHGQIDAAASARLRTSDREGGRARSARRR